MITAPNGRNLRRLVKGEEPPRAMLFHRELWHFRRERRSDGGTTILWMPTAFYQCYEPKGEVQARGLGSAKKYILANFDADFAAGFS